MSQSKATDDQEIINKYRAKLRNAEKSKESVVIPNAHAVLFDKYLQGLEKRVIYPDPIP